MRWFFAFLLFPLTALAQTTQPAPYESQALSGQLTDEIRTAVQWRIQALQAQDQIKKLQAELDELKKAKDAPKP